MGYLCAFLCLMICLFSYGRHRKIYHPVVSFSFLYFLITFMSSMRLFGFYEAPDNAYLIILCGVLFFAVGSVIAESKRIVIGKSAEGSYYEFNKMAFYLMLSLCLLIIIPRFITIGSYLLRGNSIGDVYVTLAGSVGGETEELAQSGFQGLLMQFVGYPILYILVPTSILLFFETFEKKYLLIAISLGVIRVLLDSRRTYLISFFLFVLVAFLHYQKKKGILSENILRRINKIKKWIPAFLAAILLMFVFVSSSRADTLGQENSFLGTFYNYYAGCVQYLGYCIENFDFDFTYGFTTFRGLFAPIFGVLKLVGINPVTPYQVATEIVNGMKYIVLYVAPGARFNSFTTCFYQFYCDGGYIGIVILSMLFGAYSQALYKRFLYDNQLRFEAKYLYYYGTILLLSFTNMRTILAFIVWPLLIERFLYKKRYQKEQMKHVFRK